MSEREQSSGEGAVKVERLKDLLEEWRDRQAECDLPRSGLTGEGHEVKRCADELEELIDIE